MQDLINYFCLKSLSVLFSPWFILHFDKYFECFTSRNEFVGTLLGGVISKMGCVAQRGEVHRLSAASGIAAVISCRGLLTGGRRKLRKDLHTLRYTSKKWKGLSVKWWLHKGQGRQHVAHSCQPALWSSVTT